MKQLFTSFSFLFILIFASFGQKTAVFDYSKYWEKVNKKFSTSKIDEAVKIIDTICIHAKNENQPIHYLKAVFCQIIYDKKYESQSDDIQKKIDKLDYEIKTIPEPQVQILYSYKADILWDYYLSKRYKILDRTTTINYQKEDISTWDLRSLVEEIIKCYRLSVTNEKLLKSKKLGDYNELLYKNDSSRIYRPTLYDLLVHRAIDFFMSEEPQIVKPAETFYLNNAQYLGNATVFSSINLSTPDSLSMKFYALQLLQQSIQLHLNDTNVRALIDVDLKRLEFVKKNATFANKDSLYLDALKNLYNRYHDNPEVSTVCYNIAEFYNKKAPKYDSLSNPIPKNYYLEALKYIDIATNNYPNTIGAKNSISIRNEIINLKKLSVETENYSLPDIPSKIKVTFQNVKTLYSRVIPITFLEYSTLKHSFYGSNLLEEIVKLNYLSQSKVELPFPDDYQERSVEVALQPLKKGDYIILFSDNENFNYKDGACSFDKITITNLAFVERIVEDGSIEIGVFDRKNGRPVKNATVAVKVERESPLNNEMILSNGKTDADGHCKIPKLNDDDDFISHIIKTEDDQIETSEKSILLRHYNQLEYEKNKTFIFTDRAIYRPGQTIYFKGIIIDSKGSISKPIAGKSTKITFCNNSQTISSAELTTNEFGSFSGSFTVPLQGITGKLCLKTENTDFWDDVICVRVEEYKRPKFEATFKPIKGSYRLNDTITVTGVVKAFAGNAIEGAKINYRITRSKYLLWGDWIYGETNKTELYSGKTNTNEKGEYTIDFKAITEEEINKSSFVIFYYTLTSDITDLNGETHTVNTSIPISSTSMNIYFSIPENVDLLNKNEKFKIMTTNSSNQLEPATLSVKVTRLEQPSIIYNGRFWDCPTSFIYSKEEFSRLFPFDEYRNEKDKQTWKRAEITYQAKINTKTDSFLIFNDLKKWTTGEYLIEVIGVDKYGSEFRKDQYFSIISSTSKKNSKYTHLSLRAKLDSINSKKYLLIDLESKHSDATVFVEVFNESNLLYKDWIRLDKNIKNIKLPISKNIEGNIRAKAILSINNRVYEDYSKTIVVTNNKTLDIKFATFRNKLNPGQEEEWQITITGSDGKKVVSELLSSMYDASLDTYVPNNWNFNLSRIFSRIKNNWYTLTYNFSAYPKNQYTKDSQYRNWIESIDYERLNTKDYDFGYVAVVRYTRPLIEKDYSASGASYSSIRVAEDDSHPQVADIGMDKISSGIDTANNQIEKSKVIQIRKNFNETAFFMPQLATDSEGNVVIKFKVPESLTRWKIMGLAHTKDLRVGQFTKELVTQKSLMVVPNQPRFFRESDQMEFNVKISNISEKDLSGIAKIEFFDALTMKPINSELGLTNLEIPFSALKGKSTSVAWKIAIPQGIMAITYRVTAQAGNFSDGEEMTLPVLTNRMLVTESLPLPINGNQTKTFSFDKLKNNTSATLKNFKYTLEFTSNPAWYAIQALPYLMEYPYECAEQTFNRFYANSIAYHIANSNPKIKAVFDSWKINSTEALMSNLEKNQELKTIMLEETPWVMDAKSESDQKKRVGLLFDLINMSNQLDANLNKLIKMQTYNGGWAWFPGMSDNNYITQYIVTGFGHLKNLGITNFSSTPITWAMITKAVHYTDEQICKNYENLKKRKVDLNRDHIGWTEIQYLYARTFFWKDVEIASKNKEAVNYFLNQSKKYWLTKGIYLQGMMALANERSGDDATAKKIMASVNDNALYSEEMGMYWRNEGFGYYWYEAPIERQALLIEAFDVVNSDLESVEKMKIWLLKQKQTQSWSTTKSTAEACYALLLKGINQLTDDQLVEIKIADKVIDPKKMENVKVEAGTGYFKTAWNGTEITPEMGNITVTKSTAGVAWGSVYWQYFENLDKITPAATPLSMKKELFVVRVTPTGEVIEPVKAGDKIKVGDKIRVRIVLRSDRDMEYVHMKDMRAAAFEPINVLSQYKYQDGLGYYESTRDAATNFFFDYLRKGTYVFEYTMFSTQKGDFSNGITTIQCMYAPEFTSHSEGIRVTVE